MEEGLKLGKQMANVFKFLTRYIPKIPINLILSHWFINNVAAFQSRAKFRSSDTYDAKIVNPMCTFNCSMFSRMPEVTVLLWAFSLEEILMRAYCAHLMRKTH